MGSESCGGGDQLRADLAEWPAASPLLFRLVPPDMPDMTGHVVGNLTVIGLLKTKRTIKPARWVVQCACRRLETRTTKALRTGRTWRACRACATQSAMFSEKWLAQSGRCHYCAWPMIHPQDVEDPSRPPGKLATRDHLQPRSRGGRTTKSNIVLACGTCNRKKGNRTEEEFLQAFRKWLKKIRSLAPIKEEAWQAVSTR